MSQQAPHTKSAPMIQEFADELTSTAEELAAALGPSGNRSGDGASASEAGPPAPNLEMVMRIPVSVKIVLGSATMPVANLVKLGRGAVIPLDRRVGEPVDVVVNGRIVARGEVVVIDEDNSRFGISLTEVVGLPGSDNDF